MLALLLATLLGVWLTRRITRPLSQLSEEMRHIAHLELESEHDYSSPLSEIDTIQTAVLAMRRGLRSFQKYVSADLVRGLAFPLPFDVISEMLGMPAADKDVIRDWSAAIVKTIDPIVTDGEVTTDTMYTRSKRARVRRVYQFPKEDK